MSIILKDNENANLTGQQYITFAKREYEEFPERLRFVLNTITFNEVPRVVGSSAYLSHKYPSDVDVMDIVQVKFDRERAASYYANQFQTFAQLILISKVMTFIDFKAGLNPFLPPLIPPEPARKRELINQLLNQKLLTSEQYQTLNGLISDMEKFQQEYQRYRSFHWSFDELFNGVKLLPNGQSLRLQEALSSNSVVKLDVVSWVESRFQSIEVFYHLQYTDARLGLVAYHSLGDYLSSLKRDILHYVSPSFYNPLKAMKRLWSYCRVHNSISQISPNSPNLHTSLLTSNISTPQFPILGTSTRNMSLSLRNGSSNANRDLVEDQDETKITSSCQTLLTEITPIFSDDIAAINQMVSDLEVLDNLVKLKTNAMDEVFFELLAMKKRAHNHLPVHLIPQFVQVEAPLLPLWVLYKKSGNVPTEEFIVKTRFIISQMDQLLKPVIFNLGEQFFQQIYNSVAQRLIQPPPVL